MSGRKIQLEKLLENRHMVNNAMKLLRAEVRRDKRGLASVKDHFQAAWVLPHGDGGIS